MKMIERGTPVLAAPWNDGLLPAPELKLHRWSHRETTGLGQTLCGVRQEDRSNAWALSINMLYPVCHDCEDLL